MTLHERLESVFRMVFDDDDLQLHDNTTAEDVDGWDSFAHIIAMCAVEEEFGVTFGTDELMRFSEVGDLKRSLVAKGVAQV